MNFKPIWCDTCRGWGEWLEPFIRMVECPDCKGTGMKKDISEIMKQINSKQPLWKKQLTNYKARQIQSGKRKQRDQGPTKNQTKTNEKDEG